MWLFSLKRDLLFFSYPLNKPLNYILSLITMCVPVSLVLNWQVRLIFFVYFKFSFPFFLTVQCTYQHTQIILKIFIVNHFLFWGFDSLSIWPFSTDNVIVTNQFKLYEKNGRNKISGNLQKSTAREWIPCFSTKTKFIKWNSILKIFLPYRGNNKWMTNPKFSYKQNPSKI